MSLRSDAPQTEPASGRKADAKLPQDHPHRQQLNDEVHARPPIPLVPSKRITYLALFSDAAAHGQEWDRLCGLLSRFEQPVPNSGANHYSVNLGPFRLTWERHTEFTRYTFVVDGAPSDPFAEPAIDEVPADWVSALPGETAVATHAALISRDDHEPDYDRLSERFFGGNPLVGAAVAGGSATALTDFRIGSDGFSRLLVLDHSTTPYQAGRLVQRILEIDTYRILALMALPVARTLVPFLTRCERELAQVTAALASAEESDEPLLLDRLTRLAAEIASRDADSRYRFSAATAYYDLIQRRIVDLREDRIQGLQAFGEFTERRLAPAMNTCKAVAERQQSLSQQVAQVTGLLSTRVGMTRERQNQAVLESLARRAKLQLRLQQTVEGLSVAAMTYYIVGLVGYAAKGLSSIGVPVDADITMAVSIPIVALLVGLGVRKIRKIVTRTEK